MKKEKKNNDEEIVKSIVDKIKKTVMKELVRAEVLPLHINVALVCAVSEHLASEALAHAETFGSNPKKRISKQINILHEQTLLELKERSSHGEE